MFITTAILITTIFLLPQLLKWYERNYFGDAWKVPGPPGIFLLGNIFDIGLSMEDIFNGFVRLRREYGSRFGLWLTTFDFRLIVSNAEDAEQILTSKHLNKGSGYSEVEPWLGKGLIISEANVWKKDRKLIAPTFHIKLLEQFFDVFNSATNTFVDILKNESRLGPVETFVLLKAYAMDVTCETIMGVQINAQLRENSEYVDAIEDYLDLFIEKFFSIFRRIKPYYKLTKYYKREQEALKIIKNKTREVIRKREEERRKSGVKKINFDADDEYGIKRKIALMDLLLDLKNDGEFTETNVSDQINTFLIAGHHTVSAALGFIMYELANHPEMQEKILEEIHYAVGKNDNEPITMQHVKKFKFMERFIKEVLRLYPPGPFIERQLSEDFTIGNYTLPKKSNVIIHIFTLHRSEEYFPDPEKFDPDRFLPENINQRHPYAYIPFSHGPRNCIGQKFAMLQMKVFLGILLRQLELKAVPNHKPRLVSDAVLKSLNGLPVFVRVRKE